MRSTLPPLCLALIACGGATVGDLQTDAAPKDASTNDAPADAAKDGPDCNARLAEVTKLEAKARVCSADEPNACANLVSGICCKLAVTDPTTQAVKDWRAAIVAAMDAGCLPRSCPPCTTLPQQVCKNGLCF